jgi:murein DD-endopeptidase MepM/ murein hydrolase activator NlpD
MTALCKKIAAFLTLGIFLVPLMAFAEGTSDVQAAIEEKNRQINALQQQITEYQNQLESISGQANTLNQQVSQLKSSERILDTSLKTTNTKLQKTNLTITKNISEIQDLSEGIHTNREVLSQSIRLIAMSDDRAPVEMFLQHQSLSDFLQDYQDISQLQNRLRGTVRTMQDRSVALAIAQKDLAQKQNELKTLSGQLGDQEKIIASQRKEKDQLLRETKNKESEYQKKVQTLQEKVSQITAEINEYESKLKFSLNAKSLPAAGSQVLGWPIENAVITQKFGKTVDSKRLYAVGTHSGVDFRAAVGTPVYAVADGIVEGTGDTDKTCPRASFGKWVFIRHDNGLSTAYGHLSLIKTTPGVTVKKGDLIAYSGNSGHTTGPHLHLTVYASNGVNGEEGARVTSRPSTACAGKTYTMPLAPTNAYLDPLLYLPSNAAFKSGGGSSSE